MLQLERKKDSVLNYRNRLTIKEMKSIHPRHYWMNVNPHQFKIKCKPVLCKNDSENQSLAMVLLVLPVTWTAPCRQERAGEITTVTPDLSQLHRTSRWRCLVPSSSRRNFSPMIRELQNTCPDKCRCNLK